MELLGERGDRIQGDLRDKPGVRAARNSMWVLNEGFRHKRSKGNSGGKNDQQLILKTRMIDAISTRNGVDRSHH